MKNGEYFWHRQSVDFVAQFSEGRIKWNVFGAYAFTHDKQNPNGVCAIVPMNLLELLNRIGWIRIEDELDHDYQPRFKSFLWLVNAAIFELVWRRCATAARAPTHHFHLFVRSTTCCTHTRRWYEINRNTITALNPKRVCCCLFCMCFCASLMLMMLFGRTQIGWLGIFLTHSSPVSH